MKQLVLVHGYLGSALNWGPIISRLRADSFMADWTIKAVDMLGHAYRPLDPARTHLTLDELTHDLMTQIPDGDFVALGHSFGLRPLLRMTHLYPDRIKGLIVEDSSPELSGKSFEFLRDVVEATPVPFKDREESRRYFDGRFASQPTLSRFLQSNVRPGPDNLLRWRFNAPALRDLLEEAARSPMWEEWSAYTGPVQMIIGENSDYTNPVLRDRCVKSRVGPTEIEIIPQSGHWVHSDQPELFTQSLIKILKALIA